MSGKSQLVGVAGLGLIGANFWLGTQRQDLSGGLFTKSASAAQSAKSHDSLKQLGAEILFVTVATVIAATSDSAGNAMLAVLVALGIVWAITHYAGGPTVGSPTS